MKLGTPTLTLDHHISHFNLTEYFYFEDVLCYATFIDPVKKEVRINCVNPHASKGKFYPYTNIKLN